MTHMMQAARALGGEQIIELFQLDLAPLGDATVLCFTRDTRQPADRSQPRQRISFMGTEYEPIDIQADGFEWSGTGPTPQPKLRITNISMLASQENIAQGMGFVFPLLSGLLQQHDDLAGAYLTRIKTFARFLDGAEDAALASQSYQWDIFAIEQKETHTKIMVEFRLSSAMDQQGRMLPVRRIFRDNCPWRYRRWNPLTGTFDYSKATCPYTGGSMFDIYGNYTSDPVRDRCSKHTDTGCGPRYGTAVRPFGGFPGTARTR